MSILSGFGFNWLEAQNDDLHPKLQFGQFWESWLFISTRPTIAVYQALSLHAIHSGPERISLAAIVIHIEDLIGAQMDPFSC